MRIIVSDSSCLIDLRKASLLSHFFKLPYEILIPNTLFEDELLKFTSAQRKMLIDGGLQVVDLPAKQVLRARRSSTKCLTFQFMTDLHLHLQKQILDAFC